MKLIRPSKELQSELDAVARVQLLKAPFTLRIDEATCRKIDETVTKQMQLLQRAEGIEFSTTQGDAVVGSPAGQWLSLFGTALIQEKAGIAFRSASGHFDETNFDPSKMISGINELLTWKQASQARTAARAVLNASTNDALRPVEECTASNGAIAAAPAARSPGDPDYWFCWQRDAGVIAANLATLSGCKSSIAINYFRFLRKTARADADLAVSRFTMSGDPVKAYGSPQLDGPAYSALALLTAPNGEYFDAAQRYLSFLCSPAADELTYDAWEFSVGRTFHSCNLARRALRRGAQVAEQTNNRDLALHYAKKAANLTDELRSFWSPQLNQLNAATNHAVEWMQTLQQVDIAVIGSVLFDYDVTDDEYNVDNPQVRATMEKIESTFVDLWPVNRNWTTNLGREGHGLGRFPEDMNDGYGSTGGNPWTFATLWGAQFYGRLVQRLDYLNAEDTGANARKPLLAKANGYLDFVLAHQDPTSLSEQIDGFEGTPRGAQKLGWAQTELAVTLALLGRDLNIK